MERKSSLKECPKCGLRNKPSATQCDFCGQNLGASDDWQQHIKDLESLNKMELRKPLDDRTSKRIASTIIRKDAPATRNVGIKEAGNIGKVLMELDEPPAKDRSPNVGEERSHQASTHDKLRIKEVGSVPFAERDAEETPPVSEGTTIAEILKEQSKEIEVASPPVVIRPVEEVPPAEPLVEEKGEGPKKEVVDQPEQDRDLEPVTAEGTLPSEVVEPQQAERTEEPTVPSPAPEYFEEPIPTNEVTVEVVQPLQEQVPSADVPSEEEKEITVSSNDSRETIKLNLVKVEKPREKLVPVAIEHRVPNSTMAAVAVLALGSVAYLVILTLTSLGILGTAAGLGGGAVSSFMIIFGAATVYPSLRKKDDDEVFICPKCHEKVGESSEGCPACGAEFDPEI